MRSSQTTNPSSAAPPTTRPKSVSGSVQPASGPSWIPRMIAPSPTAERMEPTVSNRCSLCSREWGTKATVTARADAASTTGMANTHGQLALSTTIAEPMSPRMPPAPAKPAQTPTARSRSPTGKLEVITERVAGMIIAAAAPATTRKASSWVTSPAKAAATLAAMNSTRPDTRTFLRPQRSPMAPTGMSRAARAMV